MKWKWAHWALFLLGGTLSSFVLATHVVIEKTQYIGKLNSQTRQGDVVKVMRTLSEPVLFAAQRGDLPPELLVVRGSRVRPATGGMVYLTVRQDLIGGKEARVTLKASLWVDAKQAPVKAEQRGDDVVIHVPPASSRVELRTDAPIELEVSANYRGELQVVMIVESDK
ncbi:TPA: DUF5462 family protein [Aeromonas hydrophila]|uniref:DUF5462 family protein n=1 Tax=Aeromonas hydrophila TaxID=644 RepID=UPI0038D07295